MRSEFADPEQGGFYYTGCNHEALIARQKDVYDNATPSGSAMAATALLRLAALTGRENLEEAGATTLRAAHTVLAQAPMAAGQSLIALDFLLAPPREFAVIGGEDRSELRAALEAIYARFLPHKVVAPSTEERLPAASRVVPLLADRSARGGRVTTYVCERFTCQAPVVGVEALEQALA
jgi:hypothetical protein